MDNAINYDLFGNPVIEANSLKKQFIIPPFSILDTASGDWQSRKNKWSDLGIKGEIGRQRRLAYNTKDWVESKNKKGWSSNNEGTSIFDPVLCEIMYNWFVPKNGSILDPFAGGSVRGIVSNYLDNEYTGIELREVQVDANRQQAEDIFPYHDDTMYQPLYHHPKWICGDSNKVLDTMDSMFDFIFSCPPYYDLEIYCDNPNDLSNMSYNEFNSVYESIINKSCMLLKNNRYACFVVGNCRDKNGHMMDLVGTTIRAFEKAGLHFYNDIILKNSYGNASMRANGNMKYKKVVKVHQNVLVFVKGNPRKFKGM